MATIKHFFICFLVFTTVFLSGCLQSKKKAGVIDGSYVLTAADSTSDLTAIKDKLARWMAENRVDDAIKLINANLKRFTGSDKALLMDLRGSAYFMKDEYGKAANDYTVATELAPDSASYLVNLADAYEQMDNKPNAGFYAKKILELKNASDSDKALAHEIITRSSQSHTPD